MLPALKTLADNGGEMNFGELLRELVSQTHLPESSLSETLPSGRETVFSNRLRWALSYLINDGQLELPTSNEYIITPVGYDTLATQGEFVSGRNFAVNSPGMLDTHSGAGGFAKAPVQLRDSKPPDDVPANPAGNQNSPTLPEDDIKHYFELAYQNQKELLINRVHNEPPEFFENLVIDLLLAMGYAQRRDDLASRLGRSGDGGIDGVLLEDELGLNRIYFQAKRYKPNLAVPISAVRDFAGSLESKKAGRGLFLTTSYFPKTAEKFAASISKRMVLVDGKHLASLMMRHKIGVKLRAVYEVKVIDESYFSHQTSY